MPAIDTTMAGESDRRNESENVPIFGSVKCGGFDHTVNEYGGYDLVDL